MNLDGRLTLLVKSSGALLVVGAVCLSVACAKRQPLEPTWPTSSTGTMESDAGEGPRVSASADQPDWVSGPPALPADESGITSRPGDAAPNGAETLQAPVSRTGRAEIPEGRRVSELEDVRFAFDDDALDTDAMIRVSVVANFLRDNPSLAVTLRGHTDESGTEGYNLALGSRRAEVVRDALLQRGISADRIETVSFGKLQPLDDSGTEEARAKNRRVEFFVWEM